MLRNPRNARRYTDNVDLMMSDKTLDGFGHVVSHEAVKVASTFASVRRMSAQRTMLTFQQADVVGLEMELRNPNKPFNLVRWKGHDVYVDAPEDVDNRGRLIRLTGYYQEDRR